MARKLLIDWCKENKEFGDLLLSQWTGMDENNNIVEISTISKGSNIKLKWHCDVCGSDWIVSVHSRASDKTGCEFCSKKSSGKKLRKSSVKKGINDLFSWCENHGEYGVYLKSEWTGIGVDGEIVEMSEISKGSSKKMLWRCNICGGEWSATLNSRTGKQKTGCRNCNTRSTSYPEQFIYHSLKQVFPDAVSRGKLEGYEYDIIIPSIDVYIEYSPTFTHAKKIERDELKASICKNNNKRFICIIEDSYNQLKHYVKNDEICFVLNYRKKDESLQKIVEQLITLLNISENIDFEKVSEMAFLRSHRQISYEDSVESKYPNLAKEWNYKYNGIRKPSNFLPFSSQPIYWMCNNCGHGKNGEWKAVLSNRAHLKTGCPACGYNWYDEKIHNNGNPITIKGKTDFPSAFPKLLMEWNFECNEKLNPYELRVNSHKRVCWVCAKCDYGQGGVWKTSIDQRINSKTGCPACGYNCFDDKYHPLSGASVVVLGKNDLESQYPFLAKEWHPQLNDLTPKEIKAKSNKAVFWLCNNCKYGKNGEWKTSIGSRVRYKTGCPVCSYNWDIQSIKDVKNGSTEVMVGVNDIGTTEHCNILNEWHPFFNSVVKESVKVSSHTNVYWQCQKCGYGKDGEWQNSINSRTNQKSGCPVCGYNYYDDTYHKTSGRSTVMIGVNDIATTHAEYVREWHPTLNLEKKPTDFKAGSHEKVYWVCPICGYGENGEWFQDIHVRLKGKLFCKKCRRNRKE